MRGTVRVKPRKRHTPDGEVSYVWAVKTDGSKRAHRVCATQAEAIQIGRRIAMNNVYELIVFRTDLSVRSKDTFKSNLFGVRK